MTVPAPAAVEEWAPIFTKHFTDKQLLDPAYALSRFSGTIRSTGEYVSGVWCCLCDAPVPPRESTDRHMAKHAAEIKRWRASKREQMDRARSEALALQRRERELEREVLGASSGITPERRARNKVSSIRYKIAHPEKHKRKDWSKAELATLHDSLEEALAAVKASLPLLR